MFPSNNSFVCASLDHTTLYKSCVKTFRARNKATGTATSSRIFPSSSKGQHEGDKQKIASAQYFQKAREIQENIATYKQLLKDHKRRYLGQIIDHNSMSAEDCVYVDKVS